MKYYWCISLIVSLGIGKCWGFPDPGKWNSKLDDAHNKVTVVKSLFKDSTVYIQIACNPVESSNTKVRISWVLLESECWQDYLRLIDYEGLPDVMDNSTTRKAESRNTYDCKPHIPLGDAGFDDITQNRFRRSNNITQSLVTHHSEGRRPVFKVKNDGFYILIIEMNPESKSSFTADVVIEMKGQNGFLSAADWPLLLFYEAMCLVYVLLGVAWLVVSFLQWRDLLRIQFWIGGVILLGMFEMATFYAEYSSINNTGEVVLGAVLLAEFVSCGKRTLARMLVIIVSLGFGIVKPRLGAMLHRVVGMGILYFILAIAEAYTRVMRPKNDPNNQILVATVPLAVLDSFICWWIFTSLVQTTRTLRLRRNLVKLALYRHFTNTLIFAVIASVIFMVYSIKAHHLTICFTDWKQLWIDDAYWKLLFSIILLVIMILWRPTNNNQRYAFSPLLDAPEDDDDEEEQFVNDAYGVKMRGQGSGAGSPKPKANSPEDDLKWVEENIPASLADTALPILDSDEEIMNTKFELSKMQ